MRPEFVRADRQQPSLDVASKHIAKLSQLIWRLVMQNGSQSDTNAGFEIRIRPMEIPNGADIEIKEYPGEMIVIARLSKPLVVMP